VSGSLESRLKVICRDFFRFLKATNSRSVMQVMMMIHQSWVLPLDCVGLDRVGYNFTDILWVELGRAVIILGYNN